MIIYQMKKPIECYDTDCVGVTGDNIAYTQEFYIKGVSDNSISFTLHLRFADGSVNSITPDVVIPDGEGTKLRWIVKKNDIFTHGYFELQIEARNKIGLVFQTEIVRLYADESLPVEDKEYSNPNSETVRLREEAYSALEEMKQQQVQIENNLQKIELTDIDTKADKATTLAGYGITNGENIGNKVAEKGSVTDESINYPSIKYLNNYYYDFDEVNDELANKLDNTAGAVLSDNIAGGAVKTDKIADKAVTNGKIANGAITSIKIANNAVSGSNIAQNQIGTNHLQNGTVTIDKLAGGVKTSINSKADKATTLAGYGITDGENIGSKVFDKSEITDEERNYPSIGYLKNFYYEYSEVDDLLSEKYNASNVETGNGALTPYNESMSNKINSASFSYQRSGAYVTVSVYIDFKAFTVDNAGINIMLLGLPYVCKNAVNPRELCVTTSKQQMIYAVTANTSNLTLLFINTGAFAENEKLSFTVTYKIS